MEDNEIDTFFSLTIERRRIVIVKITRCGDEMLLSQTTVRRRDERHVLTDARIPLQKNQKSTCTKWTFGRGEVLSFKFRNQLV